MLRWGVSVLGSEVHVGQSAWGSPWFELGCSGGQSIVLERGDPRMIRN